MKSILTILAMLLASQFCLAAAPSNERATYPQLYDAVCRGKLILVISGIEKPNCNGLICTIPGAKPGVYVCFYDFATGRPSYMRSEDYFPVRP